MIKQTIFNEILNRYLNHKTKENPSAFEFDSLITDNMVLQANRKITIKGQYKKNGLFLVLIDNQIYRGKTVNGFFKIDLKPMSYGGPYDIIFITEDDYITIKNVLFGEVFLMGGQSNMAITFNELIPSMPKEEINKVQHMLNITFNKEIRFVNIPAKASLTPVENLSDNVIWQPFNEPNISNMSATAYYFAISMYEELKIPIGIVNSAVGATITATWISNKYAKNIDKTYLDKQEDSHSQSRFFNGMIYPIKNYLFRGVIWYQGEGQPEKYKNNTLRIIKSWRRNFKDRNLKFHIISLPRMAADLIHTQDSWFVVRQEQEKLGQIKNISYSVNIDLGLKESETQDPIHPYDKQLIGIRAAETFVNKFIYKKTEELFPVIKKIKKTAKGILITYKNIGDGLVLTEPKYGFEASTNNRDYDELIPKLISTDTIFLKTNNFKYRYLRYGYSYSFKNFVNEEKGLKALVCIYNSYFYPANQFKIKL